ncbi:hypothetical protein BDD12DRAFT_806676 [Trichophaea hybrida]|nr:hypothetical protein BDD12DRAFT_806676 [Trichophaea hybrida]
MSPTALPPREARDPQPASDTWQTCPSSSKQCWKCCLVDTGPVPGVVRKLRLVNKQRCGLYKYVHSTTGSPRLPQLSLHNAHLRSLSVKIVFHSLVASSEAVGAINGVPGTAPWGLFLWTMLSTVLRLCTVQNRLVRDVIDAEGETYWLENDGLNSDDGVTTEVAVGILIGWDSGPEMSEVEASEVETSKVHDQLTSVYRDL